MLQAYHTIIFRKFGHRGIPVHGMSKTSFTPRRNRRGPNFKARTIYFDFQNVGRQDATRESITGDYSLCRFIRAYIYRHLLLSVNPQKSSELLYGGYHILVQKVFEGDLSCDSICMKLKFKCIFEPFYFLSFSVERDTYEWGCQCRRHQSDKAYSL